MIIGDGIMGTSLTFALSRLGVPDVTLLSRHTLAAVGARGSGGHLGNFGFNLRVQREPSHPG